MFIHTAKDKIRMLTDDQFAYKLEERKAGRSPDEKIIKRLRQMADFSFPLIQDINYLEEISGCKGLSPWQAVTATQAAIRFLLDKTEPDFNQYPDTEKENIKKYYEHLILNSEYGYEDKDLEYIKKETTVKLNLSALKQRSSGKYYLYGPCEIETSYALSRAFKYDLSAKDESGTGLCIVDKQGEEISAAAVGEEFFIKLLKKKEAESICITLSGKTSYAADVSLSELCLIVNILSKDVSDMQEIHLSRVLIKKRSSRQDLGRLPGTVFQLSLSRQVFDEAETNEEGECIFCNLLLGDYVLQEVRAAENHVIKGDGKLRLKICARQTVIEIVNEPVKGIISVFCFEENNCEKGIGGAVFNLYDADKNFICHIETNQDGIGESVELPLGDYIVKSGAEPKEYFLNHRLTKISVAGEHEQGVIRRKLIVSGRKKKFGRIQVSVHDYYHTEIRLSGAEFEIKDSRGLTLESLVSNTEGIALSKPFLFGNYKLVQKKAEEGYSALEEAILFSIEDTTHTSIAISNKKKPYIKQGLFRIQNTLGKKSRLKLPGAVFEVLNASGELVDEIKTRANEYAESRPLPFGIYKVHMREASEGCKKSDEVFLVEIDTESFIKTVTVTTAQLETAEKGRVRIFCADESSRAVKGARFQIYDVKDNLKALLVTDASGYALSGALPLGAYRIFDSVKEELIPIYINSSDTIQTVFII